MNAVVIVVIIIMVAVVSGCFSRPLTLQEGEDKSQIVKWADNGHIIMSMATKGNVIFIENLSRSLMRLGMTNFCAGTCVAHE